VEESSLRGHSIGPKMSHSLARPRRASRARRPRPITLYVVAGVLLLMLMLTGWVGARAIMAKGELEAAIPLANDVQARLVEGDAAGAGETAGELAEHAKSAASLTSDPVWRAFESLPAFGVNLTVFRQLAGTVEEIAEDAVLPLTDVAGSISVEGFKPVGGVIALQPLIDAQPSVSAAHAALSDSQRDLLTVDASETMPQVQDAAVLLKSTLSGAIESVDAIDRALHIVPAMLGADRPRNYLVLFQNPAELRSTGGISGAVALLQTQGGQMQMAKQVSSTEYTYYDTPVLELPLETRGIYGDITGQYIQDVNLTPNFVQSAELAQEMWRLQFGEQVDGVLSIDPVALSYLLRATGPITLPTGDVLSAENAVQLLLTDVYARYPDTKAQDAFFAAAAASVFSAVAGGNADPIALITALAQAGSEHRVLIWSSDDAEQSVLADTTLAGGLPVSGPTTQRFGLYFNDATAAKMGPYLDVKTAIGQSTCRNDSRPHYAVDVTLTNTAPLDAANSLPKYVTAGGAFGTAAGNIKTIVSSYGVPGMENLGLTRDGVTVPYQPATDSTHPVSTLTIELAPGESTTLRFGYLGGAPFGGDLELEMTPVIHRNETIMLDAAC
jgi:hypothetical protein